MARSRSTPGRSWRSVKATRSCAPTAASKTINCPAQGGHAGLARPAFPRRRRAGQRRGGALSRQGLAQHHGLRRVSHLGRVVVPGGDAHGHPALASCGTTQALYMLGNAPRGDTLEIPLAQRQGRRAKSACARSWPSARHGRPGRANIPIGATAGGSSGWSPWRRPSRSPTRRSGTGTARMRTAG